MIQRKISKTILTLSKKFKAITVTGPRQSGKTTLVKHLFPKHRYVSLEELDNREFAANDPRGFLGEYNSKIIIDEVQRVPNLLSYLQTHLDDSTLKGNYILTGSQNFQLSNQISQTLVGRTAIVELLPLEMSEILKYDSKLSIEKIILNGGYPSLYSSKIPPGLYFDSYISLYLERDVRDIKYVINLAQFQKFIHICAGRVGQLLNLTDISNVLGVDHKTVESWISILETSFIAFRLQPYFENVSSRNIKTAKIYFYDTGLVCQLLRISNITELQNSTFWGNIFENFVISDAIKQLRNLGDTSDLFFVRDKNGHEIDLVYPEGNKFSLYEIKAAKTFSFDFLKSLDYYSKVMKKQTSKYVIYRGLSTNYSRVKAISIKEFEL